MARRRSPSAKPPAAATAPDDHERWALLWLGMLRLLEREEPQAYRRLMVALERHGLAGPMMHWARDRKSGTILPYDEHVSMSTGVIERFDTLPLRLAEAVFVRARAFADDPYVGRLQGKLRARAASDRELLLAYKAARWKIQRDARARQARVRGAEALSELAHATVGRFYGLTAESVRSFLQDARKNVRPKTKKLIMLLSGATAWELTLGAARDNSGGPKK